MELKEELLDLIRTARNEDANDHYTDGWNDALSWCEKTVVRIAAKEGNNDTCGGQSQEEAIKKADPRPEVVPITGKDVLCGVYTMIAQYHGMVSNSLWHNVGKIDEAAYQRLKGQEEAYKKCKELLGNVANSSDFTLISPIPVTPSYKLNAQQDINDPVNHPAHYCDGGIETIDFILAKRLDFLTGQVCKYISRAGKKDPTKEIEDLKKARFYLNRKIAELEQAGL